MSHLLLLLHPLSSLRHPVVTPITVSPYPRSLHRHSSPVWESAFMGGGISPSVRMLRLWGGNNRSHHPKLYLRGSQKLSHRLSRTIRCDHLQLRRCTLLLALRATLLVDPSTPPSFSLASSDYPIITAWGGEELCFWGPISVPATSGFPPDQARRSRQIEHTHARVRPACA